MLFPSGSAAQQTQGGPIVGGDIGVALSSRITAGIRFDIGSLTSKVSTIGPSGIPTGDNRWMWYAGGLFGEYVLVKSRFYPVVGGLLGVDGTHISYSQETNGASGAGNYGAGYGAFVGLRYRASQRIGGMLDIGIENSPGTSTGPYYPARMALAAFF